jgi:hypothetical protein
MKDAIKILGLVAIIMVSSLFIFSTEKTTKTETQLQSTSDSNTSETYQIKALKIPAGLNFAGEKVPMQKEGVRERIDRELLVNTYWQSNGLLMFKRANKYFPIIEPILKENGVPDDFKYLAVIESGLQNVTSPAGARGVWQLMKTTAKENGLEVNSNVDERYHLEKATLVACEYLKEAKEKFGSWTMAAAAYNAGRTGMQRKINAQQVHDYYDLLLGEETSRYIPRIIAVKEILSNPKKYGFLFDSEDLYTASDVKIVKVDTVITNIASFSKDFDINYKILKAYNPWLRENKLNNASKKMYEIRIPVNAK